MSGCLVIPADPLATTVEGYVPEIAPDMRGWYRPRVDATTAVANRITGQPTATISGTPTYAATHIGLRGATNAGGVARIQTGIAETASMTVAVLARTTSTGATSPTSDQGVFWGNFGTSPGIGSLGFTCFVATTGTGGTGSPDVRVDLRAYYDVAGVLTLVQPNLNIADPANWMCLIGVVEAGVGVGLYEMVRGLAAFTATTNTRLVNPTRTIWVGDTPNNAFGGVCDVAAVAIRAGAAGALERQAIYSQMREEAAAIGLVI